jgi:enoyl-CoA hydratase/carnithine racemase
LVLLRQQLPDRHWSTPGRSHADARLVDLAVPEAEVLTQAIELVRPLAGKDPGTLGAIKATMYAAAIVALQPASDVAVP